jgi:biotin carboxylase
MLVVFVAPYFSENAKLFLGSLASLGSPESPEPPESREPPEPGEGVRVAVISQDDPGLLAPELRARISRFERVADALASEELVAATRRVSDALGPVHRLLGVVEQLQEPLATAREVMGLPGMSAAVTRRFRDKTLMKQLLREAGLPVARHRQVDTSEGARAFAAEVGYPVVVKPPAGAASQTTFRADDEAALTRALGPTSLAAGGVVLVEELVTGQEGSFDAFVRDGQLWFHSVSEYHPTPLEVMENPWIQWTVLLRREPAPPELVEAGRRTLEVLGLETGMCHLEWFRRRDGGLVVSEVGARPPGAQLPTLISRAHDVDCLGVWARLMVRHERAPIPERAYATGGAYLRGQGEGRVRAVNGLDQVVRELGPLVTDVRAPSLGQEKSKSYEGEGFVLVRHPETRVVEEALRHVISTVRVELG